MTLAQRQFEDTKKTLALAYSVARQSETTKGHVVSQAQQAQRLCMKWQQQWQQQRAALFAHRGNRTQVASQPSRRDLPSKHLKPVGSWPVYTDGARPTWGTEALLAAARVQCLTVPRGTPLLRRARRAEHESCASYLTPTAVLPAPRRSLQVHCLMNYAFVVKGEVKPQSAQAAYEAALAAARSAFGPLHPHVEKVKYELIAHLINTDQEVRCAGRGQVEPRWRWCLRFGLAHLVWCIWSGASGFGAVGTGWREAGDGGLGWEKNGKLDLLP